MKKTTAHDRLVKALVVAAEKVVVRDGVFPLVVKEVQEMHTPVLAAASVAHVPKVAV